MPQSVSRPALLTLIWLLLVFVALLTRPLLPIDETRYLSVAWEMHNSGDWLVMHLNGALYSHKPPLLFWLINLGWKVFGVSELWGRLVAPLFGLASLFLCGRLAEILWPGRLGSVVRTLTPLILIGALLWTVFTTLTMFDTLVAFFALLGILGLLEAERGRMRLGFAVTGVAIGLGVLSKGPVILVYLLPAALLAPLWARERREINWWRWYVGVLLALVLGTAIALAWAVPAAYTGGPEYADQIFWRQTSGRVVDSFAHRRPFWWYLPLLPLLLFPWSFWPPLWRGLAWLRRDIDPGIRLCLIWFGAGLVIFSAISGKQIHYLLPMFPAAALLLGRFAAGPSGRLTPRDQLWPSLAILLLGGLLVVAPGALATVPKLADRLHLPDWAALVAELMGGGLIVLGLVVTRLRTGEPAHAVPTLSALSIVAVILVHGFGLTAAHEAYDLQPAANLLHKYEQEQKPIAWVGEYHAEFQFLGRLKKPLQAISRGQIGRWIAVNPKGVVVMVYSESEVPETEAEPLFRQPHRGRVMIIWDRAAFVQDPDLLR